MYYCYPCRDFYILKIGLVTAPFLHLLLNLFTQVVLWKEFDRLIAHSSEQSEINHRSYL